MGTGMDDYDYALPEAAIAQEPAQPRESARLLVAGAGGLVAHRQVRDLPELLGPGDVLVVNDTRVIPARLRLHKPTGGQVEVLLLEPANGATDTWSALVRPGRRVSSGTRLMGDDDQELVEVGERGEGGIRYVRLLADAGESDHLGDRAGLAPGPTGGLTSVASLALPPYIHTPLADPERYQTVYATHPGSVAAPTAGLHLTHDVLDRCRRRGAQIHAVDLTVGLDTFRPITAEQPENHVMHAERYAVPAATMEACAAAERVVAIGTTTVRALESAAATGELSGRTRLFIRGDYPFAVVDVLLTNFHVPRSSLLLLLAAFYGPGWRALYDIALAEGYRFLSFGDAMFIPRAGPQPRPPRRSGDPNPAGAVPRTPRAGPQPRPPRRSGDPNPAGAVPRIPRAGPQPRPPRRSGDPNPAGAVPLVPRMGPDST